MITHNYLSLLLCFFFFFFFFIFFFSSFTFSFFLQQVFRRRVGELENLTGEQIEKSRKELADLERKFLERVAQTNRSKTSGGGIVKCKSTIVLINISFNLFDYFNYSFM